MQKDRQTIDHYLRASAPWPIPATARFSLTQKAAGYWQAKYNWQKDDWHYEARWHEPTPNAQLVKWPSWRLDRVKPGQGFGSDAHARMEQSLVDQKWLPTKRLRYSARRLQAGCAGPQDRQLMLAAHYRSINHEQQ